ncbi:response regulator transcription factor [Portibacter lacus]|uniref:DNA-binding response regulator n=1 Tax=Portibacter lacus TaxID=1099794 RepID=A0AA37WDX6_9BACT|nr:response regulator transcription factor [Portibacter lacus]GLR16497.1 DNA-binding response regulator [Portibacter lacus]
MIQSLEKPDILDFDNLKCKILLVDDEQDILDMLGYNLTKEGFEVFYAHNGQEAIEKAQEIRPELIVLDIMMPHMDGVEACKRIKAIPELRSVMVAFLTARSEEYSEIACLEAGADDFIKKPVRPRLFITHMKALFRRYLMVNEMGESSLVIRGNLKLNLDTYQAFRDQEEISLTKKEFDLLNLLMSRPEKVLLRQEIYRIIWGNDIMVGERTIDVHISKLREKIGHEQIVTVKKVGYRFVE